jgi:hypothetical protein
MTDTMSGSTGPNAMLHREVRRNSMNPAENVGN